MRRGRSGRPVPDGLHSSAVRLSSGTRVGPYEVVDPLGRGGMGEVYRARDTRLGRLVAIKVLSEADALDPERRRRLTREAQAIAALDHPHICALYDVGTEHGMDYLVMPCLEGRTLAAQLDGGPLPVPEAVRIAAALAAALAAAHRLGIVHRDLKPGNVMLTPTGPRLLDFGLARDTAPAADDAVGSTATLPGLMVGTVPYMAPEQVRGEAVDGRCDIFALGAVTYEMLTARPAFGGASAADVAGAVLLKNPEPLADLRPDVPPALARLVERCLVKDPGGRFQSASDLAFALDTIGAVAGSGSSPAHQAQPGLSTGRRWALAAGVAAVGLVLAGLAFTRPAPASAVTPTPKRLSLNPPEGMRFVHGQMPMLSPDGSKVAANLRGPDGRLSAWVMDLTTGDARALPDASGGARWFWKPDSTMFGFFAEGQLRVASAAGGPPVSVASNGALQGFGATWNTLDDIVYAPSDTGLWATTASGGNVRQLTQPGALSAIGEWWPAFLSDAAHFVSFLEVDDERSGIYAASLDAPTPQWLLPSAGRAVVAGDYLLFPRDGTLFAQRLDPAAATLSGAARSLGLSVAVNPNGLNTLVSASEHGELLLGSEELMQARLVWFDRTGRELGEVGPPRAFRNAVLSPDGSAILEDRRDARTGRHQVWRYDVGRQSSTLLFEHAYSPQWSPDGTRVAYSTSRTRPTGFTIAAANGAGPPARVHSVAVGLAPVSDWSPDGRLLAFAVRENGPDDNLYLLDLASGTPKVVADSRANEFSGVFSPDGQWLAYWSDESGQRQVYVRHLESGARQQVSTAGGANPRWRRDGTELFFLAPDGTVMAVSITPGATLGLSEPRALFATGADAISRLGVNTALDVSADGQRFLVRVPVALTGRSPVTLILNWPSLLVEGTAAR